LKLPWVAIELDQRDGQVVCTEHGHADHIAAEPATLPLVHGDEQVGRLIVLPRSHGSTLSPRDRRILRDVAHQAGALAATARLTRDLQRSRERLVVAREQERRRIRRDLHDGLGPTLAAQTLALDLAADRVAGDPTTRALLVRLKRDTQSLVADIRRLVHGLRPPALDELGLAGALVTHVAQIDGSGDVAIRIRTDPDPLPDLPAAVEVAAWRIAREALTNVVRHAHATTCTITLALRDAHLSVEVIDDGVGLPIVPRAGIGLQSMHDRAEELGGTLTATDAPGAGTIIDARLPANRDRKDDTAATGHDRRVDHEH
jgi:signal transduction histidine kinase